MPGTATALATPPPAPASYFTTPVPTTALRRMRALARVDTGLLGPLVVAPEPRRIVESDPSRALYLDMLVRVLDTVCTSRDGELVGEGLWYVFHDPEPDRPTGIARTWEYAVGDHCELDVFRPYFARALRAAGRWLDPDVCRLFASYVWRRAAYQDHLDALRDVAAVTGRPARSARHANVQAMLPPVPRGYFVLAASPVPYALPVSHRGRARHLTAGAS